MSLETLAILALVGLCGGFVDAIAGGGGLLTVPAFALVGLDPVAVVATNKLSGTLGTGSATMAFARAGRIDLSEMWPSALSAALGAVLGALALPFAPREAAYAALPFILVAVALGAVRNLCWNWLEAISSGLRLSDHAARSMI
jgi:uncharacterized membrane protein YfcA